MNGNYSQVSENGHQDIVELGCPTPLSPLHRLAAARKAKGVSYHALAVRFGVSVEEVQLQEEAVDLSIGTLSQWAAALNMPVTELVVEPEEWKHSTHLAQFEAERLMRVASKLRERTRRRSIQRLAQTFVEQLTEILPVLQPSTNGNGRKRPTQR